MPAGVPHEVGGRIPDLRIREHPRLEHPGLLAGGLARPVHPAKQQTATGEVQRLVLVLVDAQDPGAETLFRLLKRSVDVVAVEPARSLGEVTNGDVDLAALIEEATVDAYRAWAAGGSA
ncbi:hypothetical protein [Pseudonocardia parietis]|uniref:Uncharacterized protein n=1 Tax=Pseudonocardia parietis TaxID=570936 RepID=A0ABS4VMN6_9PSEU|nr:hypothetical protein [Pseudonocardia parietis]MBP2365196.1 hypothetical protein [Pseudonocardia parietis]